MPSVFVMRKPLEIMTGFLAGQSSKSWGSTRGQEGRFCSSRLVSLCSRNRSRLTCSSPRGLDRCFSLPVPGSPCPAWCYPYQVPRAGPQVHFLQRGDLMFSFSLWSLLGSFFPLDLPTGWTILCIARPWVRCRVDPFAPSVCLPSCDNGAQIFLGTMLPSPSSHRIWIVGRHIVNGQVTWRT